LQGHPTLQGTGIEMDNSNALRYNEPVPQRAESEGKTKRKMLGTDTETYQVTLPVFEGPLDLLLHLIEREELDITEVSLAQVTNQYLDYIARLSERDPDSLADFLVVAAKLLLIKSRVLLPKPPAAILSEEEDVGEDLIRQLIEYKKFKEAARWLGEVEALGLSSFVRMAGAPPVERVIDLDDVTLDDLMAAVRMALSIQVPASPLGTAVPPVVITIAQQMDLIERRTMHGRQVSFRRLLERATTRLEVIVTLLALLEMVKQLRVTIRQTQLFSDIVIEQREPATTPPDGGEKLAAPPPGPQAQS
jgi:segregation and condensation protein A